MPDFAVNDTVPSDDVIAAPTAMVSSLFIVQVHTLLPQSELADISPGEHADSFTGGAKEMPVATVPEDTDMMIRVVAVEPDKAVNDTALSDD